MALTQQQDGSIVNEKGEVVAYIAGCEPKPEPAKTEPAKVEVKPEPMKSEPVKVEPKKK